MLFKRVKHAVAGSRSVCYPINMNSHTTRRDFGRFALTLGSAAGASRLHSATNGPEALDEALRSGIQRRGIPAVAAMVTNGHQVVYSGAFGTRDAASNLPVSVNSIFSIASMTKAITTTAAMQ